MFKDEIVIYVKAGDGGKGCVSFHREKFQPKGGPDGGNGGKGGDIIIKVNPHLNSLYHLTHQSRYVAQNGKAGGSNNRTGKNGRDLIIEVPLGTIIRDYQHKNILKDMKEIGDQIIICRGGKGGRGNRAFASSTRQTPHYAEPGQKGEERYLHLELKLIADIGLVGLPNAGKSLLLKRLTAARPKVADYPFTTLEPYLGILEGSDYQTLVIADLPGLIEGAHLGKGLGDKFLKHIERTRIIAHVIDFAESDPLKAYQIIRQELAAYSPVLARKPEIIIANKMDLPEAKENYLKLQKAFLSELKRRSGPKKLFPISALNKTGLNELVQAFFKMSFK